MATAATDKLGLRELLTRQGAGSFDISTRRPGVEQVSLPAFHPDGDRFDIFVEASEGGRLKVSDYGLTLMRLSYDYELDSETKRRVFNRMLRDNGLTDDNGALVIETERDALYPSLLQFVQGVAKVTSMRHWRREVIHSLFFESLADIVKVKLARFQPEQDVYPLDDDGGIYRVDYRIQRPRRPVFLFGVNGRDNAHLAVISMLQFQNKGLAFQGAVVAEELESLTKADRLRVVSAADKVFPTLDDFRQHGEAFLERAA